MWNIFGNYHQNVNCFLLSDEKQLEPLMLRIKDKWIRISDRGSNCQVLQRDKKQRQRKFCRINQIIILLFNLFNRKNSCPPNYRHQRHQWCQKNQAAFLHPSAQVSSFSAPKILHITLLLRLNKLTKQCLQKHFIKNLDFSSSKKRFIIKRVSYCLDEEFRFFTKGFLFRSKKKSENETKLFN